MTNRFSFSRQGRPSTGKFAHGRNVWFVSVDGVLNWMTVEQVQGGWLARDTDGTLVGQGTSRLDAVESAFS